MRAGSFMQTTGCGSPSGCSPLSDPAGAGGRQPTLPAPSYRDRLCQDRAGCAGRATLEWQLLVDQGRGQLDPRPKPEYPSPRRCQGSLCTSSFKVIQSNAWSCSVKYANAPEKCKWNGWIYLHADLNGAWRTVCYESRDVHVGRNTVRHEIG